MYEIYSQHHHVDILCDCPVGRKGAYDVSYYILVVSDIAIFVLKRDIRLQSICVTNVKKPRVVSL